MNKIKINITGPRASGKTITSAVLTWALMKFGLRPVFVGQSREAFRNWQQLSGDEMLLSQTFAKHVNEQKLPLIEITETDEDIVAQLATITAERDALKAELDVLKMKTDPITALAEAITEKK